MQKCKKVFASLLSIGFVLLCACTQDSNQEFTSAYPPNMSINANQIFLYKPYEYQLGVYDLELMQWDSIDDGKTPVQGFGWGNVYPYFVVGQQYVNPFYAGKATDHILQFNFLLENEQEALVPFATNGEVFLYIIEQVTENNDFFKKIVTISDDGKTTLIVNLDGMPVMGGVIAGNYLYFTCPVQDSDFYEVWKVDLSKTDQYQKPILVREDYSSYKIYQFKEKVLFLDSQKRTLYNDEISIKLNHEADSIVIDDEVNLLVEMHPNAEMSLELVFTDILSGSLLGTYKDAINFTREGSIVTIYGNGFIEHLDLAEGE
jgi:hypothetical protein